MKIWSLKTKLQECYRLTGLHKAKNVHNITLTQRKEIKILSVEVYGIDRNVEDKIECCESLH